jgi:hypothetical protein
MDTSRSETTTTDAAKGDEHEVVHLHDSEVVNLHDSGASLGDQVAAPDDSDEVVSAMDADSTHSDEVVELPVAPVGARICIDSKQHGHVRSISPGCTHMMVHLEDASAADEEVSVHADSDWTLAEPGPAAAAEASGSALEECDMEETAPILENWRWTADGALCGYVYGKDGYRDGELMTTSVVPPEGRFEDHVVRVHMAAPAHACARRAGCDVAATHDTCPLLRRAA